MPIDSTASTTPELQWTPVAGAVSYDVVVRNLATKGVQFAVRGIEATTYTSPELPHGNYELWVVPNATSGFRGTWASKQFRVGPPQPVVSVRSLGFGYVNELFEINWTAVADAEHYDLWISNRHGVVVREPRLFTTQYFLNRYLPYDSYRVWLRAVYADGSTSIWSNPVPLDVR